MPMPKPSNRREAPSMATVDDTPQARLPSPQKIMLV